MLHTYHHHPSTLASQCCNSNELKICIYDIELRYMHLYAAWLREWPLQSWNPVRHDYGYRIVPNYLVNYLQLWDKRPLVIPCEKYFLVLVLDCLLYYAFALDKLPIGYAKWLSASLKASKSTGGRFLHVFNYEVWSGLLYETRDETTPQIRTQHIHVLNPILYLIRLIEFIHLWTPKGRILTVIQWFIILWVGLYWFRNLMQAKDLRDVGYSGNALTEDWPKTKTINVWNSGNMNKKEVFTLKGKKM